MKDLLDVISDLVDMDRLDWEAIAESSADDSDEAIDPDESYDEDTDESDPAIAYERGYNSDAYADCPFENGSGEADRWLEGRDAAELDAWQNGELPTQYREPD